jgi:hypothetical protein
MRLRHVLGVLTGSCLVAACGGDGGDDGIDLGVSQECNPLGFACANPWPSSIYEVADAASPTGRRLNVQIGTLPTNIDDIRIEPALFNTMDGFSSAAPIVTVFPAGVDPANLPHYSDFAASVAAGSPTVLLDMETGELVHHFAEIDMQGPAVARPDRQALYIRPARMLEGGRRYAVAIKRTLKAPGGGDLPIAPGYQSILDDTRTNHALLEAVRPRYTEIFAALAQHGIQPTDLVSAWDFTTASRDSRRADLIDARTATLAAAGVDGANLTFNVVTSVPSSDPLIALRIDGTYQAPLFLSNGGAATSSTQLLRGADGKPMANGLYDVPFTAIVPQCALDATEPVPMAIYGHGLLGDSSQVHSSGTRHMAKNLCMVVVGTDMRGMSNADLPNVALALNDVNNGPLIFDGLIQGMMNHIALVQIARGPMAQTLFLEGGTRVYVDPDQFHYYGISQGGIFGTTVCAIDPVIEKCVVQVGAINYSMMLERSLDWPTYGSIVAGAYPDPLDTTMIISLMQMMWDRTDPTAVADVLVNGGFPGSPPKQVLMQIAVADVEVPNIASEYQARTMGIPTLTPSPYVPFGTEGLAGPLQNALVIYDFGLGDTIPPTNLPPPDNDVHSSIRNKGATMDMMREFYSTGNIIQTCTGASGCTCDTGGCGAQL